jgi:hypothetical protein
MQTSLSVILCTHNPRPEYLSRVLEPLPAQTLSAKQREFLLVDNASGQPVAETWDISWHSCGRPFREEELAQRDHKLRREASRRGLLPSMPNKKGKGPNVDSIKRRKSPFISDRIFKNIERRRWFAALDDGA